MEIIDLKGHYCLNKTTDIHSICSELFKLIDINYFCYISIDIKNQRRFFITTHPDWLYHFYKNGLYKNPIVIQAEYLNSFSNYLWSDFPHEKPFTDCKEFNINSGVTIINSSEDFVNIYCFGSSNIKNDYFYLSSLKYLYHFITYFHDVGAELIKNSKKNSFSCIDPSTKLVTETDSVGKYEKFLSQMKVKRIYVDNEGTYLTKQEALCTYLLMRGETAKTTAKIMGISNRTVENYLVFVKEKLDCSNSSQVFKKISKSCLFKQFILFGEEQIKHL